MSQQVRKRKDNTPVKGNSDSSEPLLEKKDDDAVGLKKVHSPQKEQLISSSSASADSEKAFDICFTLITVLAVLTRLYKIHEPNQVVFDEVHFGKFASFYLRREYFFDVHPPLGKMLIAFAGWCLNYDGHFLFEKIGLSYTENNVPYIGLRVFCAMWGIMVVPMGYMILREMGVSLAATILGSTMLLLGKIILDLFTDNALVAQSRLILLDSQLMFFCTLTIYCWIRFFKLRFWYL
jgi:dolichyl-phosphate-mannose-protein mannosyltransferase